MTSPTRRRPLPALVFLVALCLLTALVWWRVLDRGTGNAHATQSCGTGTPHAQPKHLPQQRAVQVTVLNSTQRDGLGATVRDALLKDGFTVPEAAKNDDDSYGGHGQIAGVAEIRYGPNGAAGATLLDYYFPGATMLKTTTTDSAVIVSVGAKFTKTATPAQVAAALKKDGITLVATIGTPTSPAPSASC